jgi:D-aminoacyl-tRNA deacylase
MKYLLFTSKQDASRNIARHLIETEFFEASGSLWEWNGFTLVGKSIAKQVIDRDKNGSPGSVWEWNGFTLVDMLTDTVLDILPPKDAEMAIVLSPHRSETGKPCLTTHTSGNWCPKADFGGSPSTLSFANASFMKNFLLNARELNEGRGLGFEVCYEADHHGPTVDIPYTFVEVGSSEKEWNDLKACSIAADAVMDALKSDKKYDAFFGIGYGHYMPSITKYSMDSECAAGHMLAAHSLSCLDSGMFSQAMSKNMEGRARYVAVEKKAFNSAQKERIGGLCAGAGVEMAIFS